jgi:hypothetical protein
VLADLEPDTLYTLTLATRLGNIYRQGGRHMFDRPDSVLWIRIWIRMDTYHFGNLEPYPDPYPHQK